jgi:hypothetical protein
MSISAVASPIIYTPVTQPASQTSQGSAIGSEFRQLSQDIQAGNLTAAQEDYATLSKSGPLSNPNSSNPLVQDLQAVGKALQGGDIQGAQAAFSTFQTAAQQQGIQHHRSHGSHHDHGIGTVNDGSQQSDPLAQAFTSLQQTLQSNNLSGAQTAFATIQEDLHQAGFSFGSGSTSGGNTATAATPAAATNFLNVSA